MNPDLLYVGTEFAVHATVDGGRSWARLMGSMPTVAVHDLVIHPRDGDLIAATHGRSIWILDDVTALQQLSDEVLASDVHLFENRVATLWKGVSRGATRGHMVFTGRNPLSIDQQPPGNSPSELANSAAVHYYLREEANGRVAIEISDLAGEHAFTGEAPGAAGINRFYWNLRFDPTDEQRRAREQQVERLRAQFGGQLPGFLQSGPEGTQASSATYRVKITVKGRSYETTIQVREDPEYASVR